MGSRWSDEVAEELQDEESQEEDDKELLDEMEAQEVMKSQDEGVESQGETESQDETESQMEAESQEETESQDEMLSQMETPDNLHGNWADEVEDMISKKIDKELKLQRICCGQSGHIRQICCRCQQAGHCARECDAERALDGEELPIPGNQRKQALPEGAGGHLVGGLNTGKHSPEKAPKNCNCEEKRICYGCGEKGHLKHQCPKTNTNGNGSKDGNHHHHGNHHVEESFSGKCYRCMRAGHIARECFARKTLDGVMLPIPGEEKGKVTHLTDGEVPLPKQKMSVIHERDEEGEVDVSSAEEDY